LADSRSISSLAAQAPQRRELCGQFSAGQRRSLIERTDVLLQQRQVVQWVEDEVFALVGAG
jgi:hypothetical protein